MASLHYLIEDGHRPPVEVWRAGFAPEAACAETDTGPFTAGEAPDATLAALTSFL